METIHLPATYSTPEINFSYTKGELSLSGRSTHENPVVFYQPMLEWLDDYLQQPRPHTTLHINLEYFNTSSSKCLLDILKKIKTLSANGNQLTVKWQYQSGDEDMQEAGEDYSAILQLPFEFIEQD